MQVEVFQDAVAELNNQADALVERMKARTPRGKTGNLAKSIRKVQTKNPLVVRVEAGGPLTTHAFKRDTGYVREVVIGSGDTKGIAKKKGGAGVTFDYSRAVEFGTHEMPAEPFFFPTYRGNRPAMRRAVKSRIKSDIEKHSAK